MTGRRKGTRLIGAMLVVATLAACASNRQRQIDLESMEAKDIFALGEQALERSPRQPTAGRYFAEVERLYP